MDPAGAIRARQEALTGQFRPGFDSDDLLTSLRNEINGDWLIKRGLLRAAPNATPYANTLYLSLAPTMSF